MNTISAVPDGLSGSEATPTAYLDKPVMNGTIGYDVPDTTDIMGGYYLGDYFDVYNPYQIEYLGYDEVINQEGDTLTMDMRYFKSPHNNNTGFMQVPSTSVSEIAGYLKSEVGGIGAGSADTQLAYPGSADLTDRGVNYDITFTSAGTYYNAEYDFTTTYPVSSYINIGFRVISAPDVDTEIQFQFCQDSTYDGCTTGRSVYFDQTLTSWTETATATQFDYVVGDFNFISMPLNKIGSADDLASLTGVRLYIGEAITPTDGVSEFLLSHFSITTEPLTLGEDSVTVLDGESKVYFNMTAAQQTAQTVTKTAFVDSLDITDVSAMDNAVFTFHRFFSYDEQSADNTNTAVVWEFLPMFAQDLTSSPHVDGVTISTLDMWYMISGDRADYLKFQYQTTDYLTSLEGEEKYDMIQLATGLIVNTIYSVQTTKKLGSNAELVLLVGSNAVEKGFTDNKLLQSIFSFIQDIAGWILWASIGFFLIYAYATFTKMKKPSKYLRTAFILFIVYLMANNIYIVGGAIITGLIFLIYKGIKMKK